MAVDEEALRAEKLAEFTDEARKNPLRFLQHDVNAHEDDAICEMVELLGIGSYGRYWQLMELLARRSQHCYDVSDRRGWRKLSIDMSSLEDFSVDECQEFVRTLCGLGLLSDESFREFGTVCSERLSREVERYAEETASKKLGGWNRTRRNLLKSQQKD